MEDNFKPDWIEESSEITESMFSKLKNRVAIAGGSTCGKSISYSKSEDVEKSGIPITPDFLSKPNTAYLSEELKSGGVEHDVVFVLIDLKEKPENCIIGIFEDNDKAEAYKKVFNRMCVVARSMTITSEILIKK